MGSYDTKQEKPCTAPAETGGPEGAEHSCLQASTAAWLSTLHLLHHHPPPPFQGVPLALMWDEPKRK